MKRLILSILILFLLLCVTACSNNPDQNNYENSTDTNELEDVYEDQGGDPDIQAESYTLILPDNQENVNDYTQNVESVWDDQSSNIKLSF